jgi:Ca2+-binding EF-hand superfamily protein
MMAKADVDTAGTMGYDAFREMALTMGLRPSSPDLEEALLHQQIDALFDGGDVNGDGFLDKAELLDVLEILGVRDDERRSKV